MIKRKKKFTSFVFMWWPPGLGRRFYLKGFLYIWLSCHWELTRYRFSLGVSLFKKKKNAVRYIVGCPDISVACRFHVALVVKKKKHEIQVVSESRMSPRGSGSTPRTYSTCKEEQPRRNRSMCKWASEPFLTEWSGGGGTADRPSCPLVFIFRSSAHSVFSL